VETLAEDAFVKTVSRFEADLLQLLHCILKRAPVEAVMPIALRPKMRPACLSQTAVDLIADTLNKGVVHLLAEAGGWRQEKRLRGDKLAIGRLWRIDDPKKLQLEFSANSLDFLIEFTVCDLIEDTWRWRPKPKTPLTLGDELLLFYAYEAFHPNDVGRAFAKRQAFNRHGLVQLAYCDQIGPPGDEPRMAIWLEQGAFVLECLQHHLAQRWVAMEQAKVGLHAAKEMRRVGKAQQVILDSLFQHAEQHQRRDLAFFLVHAARQLLGRDPSAAEWTSQLNVGELRLADRHEVYDAALAFVRRFQQLGAWQQHALGVAYWDEDYQAAQFWKETWEALGADQLLQTAKRVGEEGTI